MEIKTDDDYDGDVVVVEMMIMVIMITIMMMMIKGRSVDSVHQIHLNSRDHYLFSGFFHSRMSC